MANLRLDTIQNMDPGSPEPIGTLTEIRKLGLRPIKYGSCSLPSRNNIGCKHYEHPEHGPCPILALCRERNRKGYENVAFVRILSPVNMKQDAVRCHQYMDTLAHADPRNGVTHIIGLGGDIVIKRRGSVQSDPNDPKSRMKTVLTVEKVPALARPEEAMADRVSTMELAKDLEVQSRRQDVNILGSLGRGNHTETPSEDQMEEPDELSDESDAELSGDLEGDGDVTLDDDLEGGDDEDGDVLQDDLPPTVAAVAKGKRRGKKVDA